MFSKEYMDDTKIVTIETIQKYINKLYLFI